VSTQLIRRIVTVDWPKQVETDGKALLISTARNGHQQIMADAASKGLQPSWEAYANTPGNSNLETVRLPGPIVYNYRYLVDLILFALTELRRQSPTDSGNYKRSHTVYVNDQPVGDTIPNSIKAGDRIYIANPVPYARRLEVGRTKGGARAFLVSKPNRIYERVTEMTKAEGKGRAKIRMGYVDLGAWTLTKNQRSLIKTTRGYAYSKRQRPDRLEGAVVTSPAIFFEAPI
jgi:hypothetical protein